MSLTLNISSICKNYNGNDVLRDCSFSFGGTGVYVLTGANGSGKSTLLRICALLERPDSGEVNYSSDGIAAEDDAALRRKITLLLPKIGVFNSTVFKNIAYGLKIRGIERSEITERVEEALEAVRLTHKSNQNALTLSSGETQRLGIARAMVIGPEVFFLDEPTAFVDHDSRGIIEEIILTMKKSGKTIIVVTTHDKAQAERLADRMLVMDEGRITGTGTIQAG